MCLRAHKPTMQTNMGQPWKIPTSFSNLRLSLSIHPLEIFRKNFHLNILRKQCNNRFPIDSVVHTTFHYSLNGFFCALFCLLIKIYAFLLCFLITLLCNYEANILSNYTKETYTINVFIYGIMVFLYGILIRIYFQFFLIG